MQGFISRCSGRPDVSPLPIRGGVISPPIRGWGSPCAGADPAATMKRIADITKVRTEDARQNFFMIVFHSLFAVLLISTGAALAKLKNSYRIVVYYLWPLGFIPFCRSDLIGAGMVALLPHAKPPVKILPFADQIDLSRPPFLWTRPRLGSPYRV